MCLTRREFFIGLENGVFQQNRPDAVIHPIEFRVLRGSALWLKSQASCGPLINGIVRVGTDQDGITAFEAHNQFGLISPLFGLERRRVNRSGKFQGIL